MNITSETMPGEYAALCDILLNSLSSHFFWESDDEGRMTILQRDAARLGFITQRRRRLH
jgi:hypothetical protein